MTDNTNKLRAVFLTALMLGSVFAAGIAFTGSAAAASTNGGTISPATVDESTTNTHTVTLEATGVNTSGDGNQVFAVDLPDVLGTSSTQVTNTAVNAGNVTFGSNNVDSTSDVVTVTLQDTTGVNSETVNVTFDITNVGAPSVASTTSAQAQFAVDANADGDYTDTADNDFTNFQQLTITDTASGAVDADAYFGDAFAGQDNYAPSLIWTGQDVAASGFSSNEAITIQRIGDNSNSTVEQLSTNANGVVTWSTDGIESDDYKITNGSTSYTFEVLQQNLDASFASSSATDAGEGTEVDLEFDSNRATYDVNVTASGLDASELETIFETNGDFTVTETYSDEDTVTLDNVEGTNAVNFSGIDTGSYDFQFNVVDTDASATDTINVTDAADTTTSFVSTNGTTRGDIATMNVSLTNTDYATVTIGTPSVNYQANVTVHDANEDGYVQFEINTYTMGNNTNNVENAFYVAGDSDDEVTSVDLRYSGLNQPIADGNYRTTVRAGQSASATADDVSRLLISKTSGITGQTIWTAPASTEWSSFVTDATLSEDSSIANGDYVVHEVSATGIFGLLQSTNEDTATAQFLEAASNGSLSLTVEQTEASTGPNADPKTLNYTDALQNNNAEVITDAQNDTLYVVADLDNVNVTGTRSIQWGDDVYNASVTLHKQTGLVKQNSTQSAEFSAAELTADLSQDEYTVEAAANQTITGTSSAADGTEYNILIESQESPGEGYIYPENTATVQDGQFSVNIDFSDAAVNSTFEVVLEGPGAEDVTATGTVVEATAPETTAPGTTTPGTTAAGTTEAGTTAAGTTAAGTTAAGTTEGTDGGPTGGGIPGFGMGIALIAVLGAALIALRQN